MLENIPTQRHSNENVEDLASQINVLINEKRMLIKLYQESELKNHILKEVIEGKL